mmetsp:Transcript_38974/g.43913  ORF Transcript_38974/g.43913 Transcript_38974/m.43913 type:complete len:201 (+) Transcript_38974:59-661(+)
MMKATITSLLLASASAFAPASQTQRASVVLNAEEFSKSIPFLVRPDKLDGSVPGDMGFDPMRLSDIQADLRYARWAEIKHGRICMLAIVGMLVQQSGIHLPGEVYSNTNIFGAVKQVGWGGNIPIFLTIGIIEASNFYKHYDDETIPGNLDWGSDVLFKLSDKDQLWRQEQEIVHGRLAMIAFVGALVQTLIFDKPLLAL